MVHKSDIQAKAQEIEDALKATQETAKSTATWVAAGVVAVVVVAYILGRRRGKGPGAIVEVYRV